MTNKSILVKRSFRTAAVLVCTMLSVSAMSMSMEEMERMGLSSSQIMELQSMYGSVPSSAGSMAPAPSSSAPSAFQTRASIAEIDLDKALNTESAIRVDDTVITQTDTLRYFGYDLFSSIPDAFKPTAVGPIDPGYMIGPGDVLRLAVWGQSEFSHELTVNNDGKVLIPIVGQVHVSGTPFSELQDKLKNLLSRHYSGLSTVPQRTFMDLSVAQLRPIRIYIMGEVRQPGGYTVSSFANAFAALYSVGGPLEGGSLREVRISRDGTPVATVDIYEYLLTGASKSDVRLQNNDVVFVPPRGKTVHISGSVLRPAIYELKDNENLQSLLSFSGGVLSASNVDKAHLQRILPFAQRSGAQQMTQRIDIDLKRYLVSKEDFPLHDMDNVEIVPLFSDLRNFVILSGAVQYPGTYQSDRMTLRDLIFEHGRMIDNKTFGQRADLIRLNEDKITTTIIPINLYDLHSGKGNQAMRPGDEVIIYDIEVSRPIDLQITVEGEVRLPDTYSLHSNMTVTDAILRAGGFTRKALKTRFDVYRRDTTNVEKLIQVFRSELPDETVSFTDESMRLFFLSDGDRIVVRPDPKYSEGRFVTVSGAVTYTGTYALENKTERLASVIKKAGGFQTDAYLNGIVITRNGRRVIVDSDAIFKKKRKKEDIVLHNNDTIYVPRQPNTVLVSGEVNAPGFYGFIPGMNMRGYIDRAGGYTDSVNYVLVADPSGETRKIKKKSNIRVNDGTDIVVTKKPPKPVSNRQGPTTFEVIRDVLAITVSALTVVILVNGL